MRKIPAGTVANNILVAELDFLYNPISAFIRLKTARNLGNITEVAVPSKFIFIYLGPTNYSGKYLQVGRAFATMMADQVFIFSFSSSIDLWINNYLIQRFLIWWQ